MSHRYKQCKVNKANAQFSTGPKTEAGKKKSSLNALRHGLTSQIVVMPHEDPEAYRSHLESLLDQYQPADPTEAILVEALADASWRMRRIAGLEVNLLSQLLPAETQIRALANLSMHSQRLLRQITHIIAQLGELQKARRNHEKEDIDDFLNVVEMVEAEDQPFDARELGFVFSERQIAAGKQARERQKLIDDAYEYCLEAEAA